MSGDMMFGKCDCCGKEKPLQRTYFKYPISCQCHNNQHAELIDHCADCIPQKPKETKVWLSVQQIDEITTLREENAKLSAQVAGLQAAAKAANELYYMVVNFGDFKNGNSYMGIDEGEVMASKVIDKMEQALAALGDAHE